VKNFALLGSVAAAALMWHGVGHAQDVRDQDKEQIIFADLRVPEILVSASRDGSLKRDSFTGSALVITAEQLDQRQIRDIADVLRDVPSLAVSETAGQTQIRLRGSEANHVLVLVDGIEVSDPGSGEYDIGSLQAEIGARVEVLRGPQSALYGNDALSGVIAYESAGGAAVPGFGARVEGGTQGTINGAARYGASGTGWDLGLSATVVSTDGQPNARNGVRDIGRDSHTLSGKGSVDVAEGFTLRAAARYVLTKGQFNDQDFGFGSPTFGLVVDSPGVGFESEAVFALIGARLDALGGDWTHDLSAQIAEANRNTFDLTGRTSDTESDRFKASYVTAYNFGGSDHSLTFAADYELEGFNNVATFDARNALENIGLVGEYRYTPRCVTTSMIASPMPPPSASVRGTASPTPPACAQRRDRG
jgi:vitamin B12 transporter